MKRYVIAAITCIALTVGVSPAAAGGGLGGVVQTLTGTAQQSTNTAGDASAFNANGTFQSNDQSQTGTGGDASTGDATTGGASCCDSGDATSGDATGGDVTQSQEASNANSTTQEASAESKAVQVLPVNVAVPICVAKACDMGSVEQSNTNTSGDASAKNVNVTDQSNEQSQTGTGGDARSGDATAASGDATTGDAAGGDVTQSQQASNKSATSQKATAVSKPVRVVGKLNGLESRCPEGRTTRVWENLPASTPTTAAARRARSRLGKEIMAAPQAEGAPRVPRLAPMG